MAEYQDVYFLHLFEICVNKPLFCCLWIMGCWNDLHTTNVYLQPTVPKSLEGLADDPLTEVWLFKPCGINTKAIGLIISSRMYSVFFMWLFIKTCRIIINTVAWLQVCGRWTYSNTMCFYLPDTLNRHSVYLAHICLPCRQKQWSPEVFVL